MEMESKLGAVQLHAEGHPEPLKSWRGQQPAEGAWPADTLVSVSKTARIHVCCSKPPGLWRFVQQPQELETAVYPLWSKVDHCSFLKYSSKLRLYPSFPRSGNKYLLSAYCVPGTLPGHDYGYRDRNGPCPREPTLFR